VANRTRLTVVARSRPWARVGRAVCDCKCMRPAGSHPVEPPRRLIRTPATSAKRSDEPSKGKSVADIT